LAHASKDIHTNELKNTVLKQIFTTFVLFNSATSKHWVSS